jgi:IS30 family transposase
VQAPALRAEEAPETLRALRQPRAIGGKAPHFRAAELDRTTGYVLIGKLASRTMEEATRRTIQLIRKHPKKFKTITADNGTEFHAYKKIEKATGVKIYFTTPYHSWERGSNENANGLIRQYLPKRKSMADVTQHDCNKIAAKLNTRPRKRYDYDTPEERFHAA